MNRGEFVTEICAILGIPEADIQTRVRAWLNLALIRIGRRHFWQDLKHTSAISDMFAASKKSYHIETDWGLTNLRHIHAIILIDGAQSRKLIYQPERKVDVELPYPEAFSTYKSIYYTRWNKYIEVSPIPGAAYDGKMRWSKWITQFTADANTCDVTNIDDIIIAATSAWGYLCIEDEDSALKWAKIAEAAYLDAMELERMAPDYEPIPVGHIAGGEGRNIEYWLSPWVHGGGE